MSATDRKRFRDEDWGAAPYRLAAALKGLVCVALLALLAMIAASVPVEPVAGMRSLASMEAP